MKERINLLNKIMYILFFLNTSLGYCETTWYCHIKNNNTTYLAKGNFRIQALNKAIQQCKQKSTSPLSCKATSNACDVKIRGHSNINLWVCEALDLMAHTYKSTPQTQQDNAIIEAQDLCKSKSHHPDSCYVNQLCCENLKSNG
jgi:hypothetical protein